MLKVYFVDDDSLIIEEMNTIINWNEFGFEVIGGNTNPKLALDEINKLKPDLIFSDIQMDEMNGLKMVSLIEYDTNVVFFSAYDRFEYVVDAIKLKALNYLKKPPKKADLIQIVKEVKEREEGKFNQSVFRITSQNEISDENEKELENLFNNFRILPHMEYRLIAVYGYGISSNFIDCLKNNSSFVYKLYEDDNMFIGLAYKMDVESIKKHNDLLCGANATIGNVLYDYHNIYNSIRKIRVNSKTRFFNQKNYILLIDDFTNKAEEIIERIINCDNLASFQNEVHLLYDSLNNTVLCADVQRIYYTLVMGLFKFGLINNVSELISISVLDFYDNYIEMVNDIYGYFSEKEENGFAESVIYSMVEEMKNNIKENSSLSMYAKKYGYNAAYLSIVFKKTMGTSFITYLTKLKMDYAKTLMITKPKYPLKSIANEVGYYDYYHFSKMFKKFVGCSPTEFKDENNK